MFGVKSKQQKEKEEIKEANQIQKDQAADNRKSGDRIISRLQSVNGHCGSMAPENQQVYHQNVKDLCDRVNHAPANALCDVAEIDNVLLDHVENMGELARRNHVEGVVLCVERLNDIVTVRNLLGTITDTKTVKKKYEVALDRAKKSDAVVKAYSDYSINKDNIRKMQRQLAKKQEEYAVVYDHAMALYSGDEKTLLAFQKENNLETVDAKTFDRALEEEYTKANTVLEEMQEAQRNLDTYFERAQELETVLEQARLYLEQADSELDQETKDTLKKIYEDQVLRIAKINDEIQELYDMRQDFHNKLMAATDDKRRQMRVLAEKRKIAAAAANRVDITNYIKEGGTAVQNETKILQGN